jgi:hypothetical protein
MVNYLSLFIRQIIIDYNNLKHFLTSVFFVLIANSALQNTKQRRTGYVKARFREASAFVMLVIISINRQTHMEVGLSAKRRDAGPFLLSHYIIPLLPPSPHLLPHPQLLSVVSSI